MILVLIPFVLLMGFFAFVSIKSISGIIGTATGDASTTSDKSVIESMNYHLRSNATDLQVELFDELRDLVKDGTDKSAIAVSVAKNFVADFYTWTNKAGSYDIGGMYYIFAPSKNNAFVQARNEFYKYVSYYINEYGKDNILEIDTIEAKDIEATTYEFEGKSYDGYALTCEWTYKECKDFPYEKFERRGYFTVVENEGRFEIVQAYGDY